jgi:hypothetical protein
VIKASTKQIPPIPTTATKTEVERLFPQPVTRVWSVGYDCTQTVNPFSANFLSLDCLGLAINCLSGKKGRSPLKISTGPWNKKIQSTIDLPAFAILFRQEFVRRFIISNFKIFGIPLKRLACAMGHIPKQIVLN